MISSSYFTCYLGQFYPAVLISSAALTSLLMVVGPATARPRPILLIPPAVTAPEPPPAPPGTLPLPQTTPGQWNSAAPSVVPPADLLPVPPMPIPRGNVGSNRSFAPPPLPTAITGPRFRVMVVQALDPERRQQLKSLVPDAFRSSYQGRPVMQVGNFPEKEKAEAVFQLVQSSGFQAIIQELP